MSDAPLLDHEVKVSVEEHKGNRVERPPEGGLSSAEAARRIQIYGYNELAERKKNPIIEFLKNFWGPMPIMIWIAIIIEAIPKHDADTNSVHPDWADFAVLLFLQLVNGLVSWHEHHKAADAVAALKSSLSPMAHVKRDGEWNQLSARELVPGDLVSLSLGGCVPADCEVLGPKQIYCDQAALTGESLPVKIDVGDVAKMGSNVTSGECDAVVVGTADKTFFGKTAKLIAETEETGHFQKVLYKITGFLMGVSLILTGTVLVYLITLQVDPLEALGICVVLLVASIPIAMQVVCTSTMAIGSRRLAEKKAIVTRLASIEELAGMNMLCSDKTGTLTLGRMQMQDILVYRDDLTTNDVLRFAGLAAKWYEPAKDAIDRLVLGDIEKRNLMVECDKWEHLDYMPFDPKYKRTESEIRHLETQEVVKVTKGAPQVILSMCTSCPDEVAARITDKINEFAARGIRSLGVASCKATGDEGWVFLGILTFLDPPRKDTKRTIQFAQELGIDVKMITGDQVAIAKETCYKLGMGTNIRGTDLIPSGEGAPLSPEAVRFEELIVELDGFAEVFPEHKYKIVDTFRKIGYRCGMTGDGVNDAPALKRADIGIAVEGATDAARAASDIVLTQPGLSVIIDAIYISRKIFKRMKNYVIYRIACTIQLLLFFFIAVLSTHPDQYKICLSAANSVGGDAIGCYPNQWHNRTGHDPSKLPNCLSGYKSIGTACKCAHSGYVASVNEPCNPPYFKLPVIALVLITILNDGTIISIAYDHVVPNKTPEKWNLGRVVIESTLLGGVACVSSIALLLMALNSGQGSGDVLAQFGLPVLSFKQAICLMYLKISLSDFLTVFAARTNGFFFMRRPGRALAVAFVFATTLSSIFASHWFFDTQMESIPGGYIAFVWIYCVLCFFIQDISKVVLNIALDAFSAEKTSSKKELHRIARVEQAKERFSRRGNISSPGFGSSDSRHSFSGRSFSGRRSFGGDRPMTVDEIRMRMDRLMGEMEFLRGALNQVTTSGDASTRGQSRLSNRSVSRSFSHRNSSDRIENMDMGAPARK